MTTTKYIVCPHCNSINRLPEERFADAPKCGVCRQELLNGKPLDLTPATFKRHIDRYPGAGGLLGAAARAK